MAEERALDMDMTEAPAPQSELPQHKKKKKKRSKFATFLWLLLLAIGAAAGLHLSGMWDGRPLFWGLIPKIPYIGTDLAEFFNVPKQYSLTVNARRAMELAEWQKRLDERERSLADRDVALGVLSGDLVVKLEDVARREELLLSSAEEAAARDAPTASEQELMDQVARTYQDMSARNAAAVIEQLRDNLAVDLLMKLPNDARASILGKVNPQKAARLTELMAQPRR